MKKNIFLLVLFIFLGVFFGFVVVNNANAQMGTQCYTGSWVQPTCNPTISDPSSCNILPPLFSGASCDQHTGYLRIQDEANAADTAAWTQLYPGKIMVGSVTGGYVVPNGGVEIFGPIVSGNFTAGSPPPTGYNSQGDIASAYDIYAGGALRITGSSSFYGTINAYNRGTFIASVINGNLLQVVNTAGLTSNATTLYVGQSSGDIGRALDISTADRNNIYIDYLGYLNATKDFQIRIDSDNDFNQNYFRVNNGDNSTVFQIAEDGNVQIAGDVSVAKTLTAGTVVANSGGAGKGKIWGNFTDLNNNTCAADQLLVYRGAPFTPGWYCVDATNVGNTTVENLLETLQAGADASSFSGTPKIGHGSGAGGVFIVGNQTAPATLTLQYTAGTQNNSGDLIGRIGFATGYNDYDEAKIEVARGAAGSGGDYPTKMSFWTTPDGSSVAQERLTILDNGNVGIGTTSPLYKLDVVNTAGPGRIRISGASTGYTQSDLLLQTATTDSPSARGTGIYTQNQGNNTTWYFGNPYSTADSFVINRKAGVGLLQETAQSNASGVTNLLTILNTGNVGINTTNPGSKLEVNGGGSSVVSSILSGGVASYAVLATGRTSIENYIGTSQGIDGLSLGAVAGDLVIRTQNRNMLFNINSGLTPAMYIKYNTLGGFVGIGTTAPTAKLTVKPNTAVEGLRIISSNYSPLVIRNSADSADLFRVNELGTVVGNFASYNGTTCTNGQILIKNSSNQWVCGSSSGADNLGNHIATQNLNMAGYNIINTNKITVNTIDPIYTIQGKKYATYVSAMTGVKEETTGLLYLTLDKKSGLATFTIDFNNLEPGSDLWLFAQTIQYQKNFDKIVLLLTPAFDGRAWYEKNDYSKVIIVYAKPINMFSQDYEVSYRLTGPRFDYQQWPNTTNDESQGLIIE